MACTIVYITKTCFRAFLRAFSGHKVGVLKSGHLAPLGSSKTLNKTPTLSPENEREKARKTCLPYKNNVFLSLSTPDNIISTLNIIERLFYRDLFFRTTTTLRNTFSS